MKIHRALIASLAMISTSALAAEQTQAEKDGFTVEQALNISGGLSQLTKFDITDKDGKPVSASYRFAPDTLYLLATNIDLGRNLETRVRGLTNDIKMQLSDGSGNVPKDKENMFQIKWAELMQAQSRIGYYHIKREDLCIEVNPKCEAAGIKTPNVISPPLLSLIIAIIDR